MAVIHEGRVGEADVEGTDGSGDLASGSRPEQVDRSIGWHPHPSGRGIVWWDGSDWTIAVPEYEPGARIVPGFLRRALMRARLG